MTFWCIVVVILTAIAVGAYLYRARHPRAHEAFYFVTVFSAFIAIVIAIVVGCIRIDYAIFEREFELKRQLCADTPVNVQYIVDAGELNAELLNAQASKEFVGMLSPIPDRVFDIKPITGFNPLEVELE